MTFRVLKMAVFLLCLGGILSISVHAKSRIISPTAAKVEAQEEENEKWEKQAKARESELVKSADAYYKQKDYRRAADYYERVVGLRYKQWDFPGSDGSLRPAYKTKTVKLNTSNTRRARERLEDIDDKIKSQKYATAEQDLKDLFEQADVEMRLNNVTEAYAIYARAIKLAEDVGKEKFAVDAALKAQSAQKGILDKVMKGFAEVQKLLDAGKPEDAAKALEDFILANYDLVSASPQLIAEIQKLKGTPVFKGYERAMMAAQKLAIGEQAFERGQYVVARRHYREVCEKYPETKAARSAEEKLALMLTDTVIKETMDKQEASEKCAPLLARAHSLVRLNRSLEAAIIAEKIIVDHPGTKWADEARVLLETIASEMALEDAGESGDKPDDAGKSKDTPDDGATEPKAASENAAEPEDTLDDATESDGFGNSNDGTESSEE